MTDQMKGLKAGPKVVCLVSDELLAFEFGIAYEVFGLPRPEFGDDWYQFEVCAVKPGRIRASGGLHTTVDKGLELLPTADLIIVPGWPDISSPIPGDVVKALLQAHQNGAQIASLCSGVVVLAEAGLLNNRKATTHWKFVEKISKRFSGIQFDPDVLYVDEGNILTAAGSAAGIDLCLHIVRKNFGVARANQVARGLVMQPYREGGQSQFIQQPVPNNYEGPRMGAVIEAMRGNLSEELNIADLAADAGMSVRTFQRKFEATTGLSPRAWILNERLRSARELLENGLTVSLDEVAVTCGFGSLPTMRHHFRNKLRTTPSTYRKAFAPPVPLTT